MIETGSDRQVHTYRPTIQRQISRFASFILTCLVYGFLFYLGSHGHFPGSPGRKIDLIEICLLRILSPVLLIWLVYTGIRLLAGLFAYDLRVSADGLEYRFWPFYHLHCRWQDIDRIGEYHNRYISTQVIYLKSYEPIGFSFALREPFKLFYFPHQVTILLTGMQGWPDGQLAADLRSHIDLTGVDNR